MTAPYSQCLCEKRMSEYDTNQQLIGAAAMEGRAPREYPEERRPVLPRFARTFPGGLLITLAVLSAVFTFLLSRLSDGPMRTRQVLPAGGGWQAVILEQRIADPLCTAILFELRKDGNVFYGPRHLQSYADNMRATLESLRFVLVKSRDGRTAAVVEKSPPFKIWIVFDKESGEHYPGDYGSREGPQVRERLLKAFQNGDEKFEMR